MRHPIIIAGLRMPKKATHDRAIGDFTQAVTLRPNDAAIYHTRGVTFYRKGDFGSALADFTKVIDQKSDYAIAYSARGITRLHLKAWLGAKADLMAARRMGVNIINEFHSVYASVAIFEEGTGINLPQDIAAMLTPPQA